MSPKKAWLFFCGPCERSGWNRLYDRVGFGKMVFIIFGSVWLAAGAPACNTSQIAGGLSVASTAVADISADIGAACNQAKGLAAQAAPIAVPTVQTQVSRVNSAVSTGCTSAAKASAKASTFLNSVNTAAAILLNVAALAGYPLPGI